MFIISLALFVALAFIIVGAYLGACFVETQDDRVRFVTAKGVPQRLQKPGWGFIWRPIEEFYDYPKRLFTFDFKEEKVITNKSDNYDENSLVVDSQIYLYLIDRVGSNKFAAAKNLWKHNLKPEVGQMIEDAERVKALVESYCLAMQREIAASMTYNDVMMTNKFVVQMEDALNNRGNYSSQTNNPFVELGINNIRYVVRKIAFSDKKMEEALYAFAVATQEGQATVKRAEDKATALEVVYTAMEKHPQAAAIETIKETGNHWILTFDPSGMPKILGGK